MARMALPACRVLLVRWDCRVHLDHKGRKDHRGFLVNRARRDSPA